MVADDMKADLDVVILGAGHAGGAAASQLRQLGHRGRITLIGDEAIPPYQRPPLSKAYFKGEVTQDSLFLKPPSFYERLDIHLKLGVRAINIDRVQQSIALNDGCALFYDRLIYATGAAPRSLHVSQGWELNGVQTLRTIADVDLLKTKVKSGGRVLVLGAGYIGLEASAALRDFDMRVTILEAQHRVLNRVAGLEISNFYHSLHLEHGVDIRLNTSLAQLVGERGNVVAAKLTDGSQIETDLVLVAIGVTPNDLLARESGLSCANGVVVDENACTSDSNIYAIGDCSERPLVHYQSRKGRLESVHNAQEQARLAVHHILGLNRPRCEVPWFWSEQYGVLLQTAGLLTNYDQTVLRGDIGTGKFAVYYLREKKLLAVDAVNSMGDFMCGKRLAGSDKVLDLDAMNDGARDPKTF